MFLYEYNRNIYIQEGFSMKYLMGIDNGGTFSKAAIFDENGTQISVASVPTVTITPKPGYTERDMNELWEVNAEAIRKSIEKSGIDPKNIAGISFSGHGKGLYLVGYDGKPSYNGIVSTDMRAWEYIEKWEADGTKEKIYPMSYQTILACQPVALLAWLRDHEPQVLENTRYIFHVKDYVRYMLTGEAYAEYTDSTGGNLVNMNTKQYDKELLDCFGLGMCMDKLPPLKYSAEICGYVTEEASKKTGLPVGIPAAAGMFDVDACGIGSGLTDPDKLCMIAGTWSINEYIAREPVTNGTVDLNSMFCMPGYFLVEESSPTSAGNMEWFIRNLMSYEKAEAKEKGSTRAVASMDKAAKLFGGGERPCIFAIGNAPTALIRLYELIREGKIKPALIIGAPVGFVNVIQSKELILSLKDTPYIVAEGRKGGSNVAAAICNALLYGIK